MSFPFKTTDINKNDNCAAYISNKYDTLHLSMCWVCFKSTFSDSCHTYMFKILESLTSVQKLCFKIASHTHSVS